MIKGIVIFFALLAGGTAYVSGWGQTDEELSGSSRKWLNLSETGTPNEAFLFLFGIAAPENEAPIRWGKMRLAQYHALLAQGTEPGRNLTGSEQPADPEHKDTSEGLLPGQRTAKEIELPQGGYFCSRREPDCITRLLAITADDMKQLGEENRVLRERVQQFLMFDSYRTTALPDIQEPFDYLFYLSAGLRLELLGAIALYNTDQPGPAVHALLDLLARTRKHLKLQDTFLGRAVVASNMADTLDILALISSRSDPEGLTIDQLTVEERDVRRIAAREFRGHYRLLRKMDRNPGFFAEDEPVPGWYVRLLFKPNMTANAMAPVYDRLAELSLMEHAAFAEAIKVPLKPETTPWISNYAGNILLNTGSEDLRKYVGLLLDLNLKIYLFNHRGADPASLSNPYYPGQPPKRTAQTICMDGPYEDPRQIRCIPVTAAAGTGQSALSASAP